MNNSNRKLATILATDCVNFSKHMQEDEEKTLRNLNECRKIIDKIIADFGGRIFNTAGDSVISEFDSPVQCVKASIEFQNAIYKRNELSVTELILNWRIGIHVDDVIVEGDNIMGSGVNIAARLESHCKTGHILVSKIVKEQTDKRIDSDIEADGTRELKNISKNFEVFNVKGLLIDEDDFFSEEEKNEIVESQNNIDSNANKKIIQTSSNKIKIAILPFDNLSKDEDSEFLVEGIFRDLSIEFSRMQEFDVMSHQACLDFKNSAENALAFAKKHKIDFLVGGNVRSAGKRIRVSVDLTDALDGSSVYADRMDRVIEDIFDMQDEIVSKMSRQLLGNIEIGSLQRIKRKPTENINSYEWLVKGNYHHVRRGKDNNLKAIEYFNKAVDLDENNARAHALKVCTIGSGLGKGWYEDDKKMMDEGMKNLKIGLEADPHDFEVLRISCAISQMMKDLKNAEEQAKRAFQINPNDPKVLNQYGRVLVKTGRQKEGIEKLLHVYTIDPIPAGSTTSCERYEAILLGYFLDEDHENCVLYAEKIEEDNMQPAFWLMGIFSQAQLTDISNIKDNDLFKKYQSTFKDVNWSEKVNGLHLHEEDEKNEKLNTFANKIFPQLKIVEKSA